MALIIVGMLLITAGNDGAAGLGLLALIFGMLLL